jgi:SAM-dependent methyltransferase
MRKTNTNLSLEAVMQKPWYEALYENFEDYDSEPYVQNTKAEIDFIDKNLGGSKPKRVLDIGCGTGRHSLELARRGYSVCGVDLSEELLETGIEQAQQEGLDVEFIQGDARKLKFNKAFDAVIILCEGGFSLVETDAMDRQILAGATRALRSGGRLFLTAPSAAFMFAKQPDNENFNAITFREVFALETENAEGEKVSLDCSQRYYTFPEIKLLLQELGLSDIELFAVTGEGYSDKNEYAGDQFEFGVTAVKN